MGVHLLPDTLLMPHTYHAGGDSTAVCLVNASDKDAVLTADENAVGRAEEADMPVPVPFVFVFRNVCTCNIFFMFQPLLNNCVWCLLAPFCHLFRSVKCIGFAKFPTNEPVRLPICTETAIN